MTFTSWSIAFYDFMVCIMLDSILNNGQIQDYSIYYNHKILFDIMSKGEKNETGLGRNKP